MRPLSPKIKILEALEFTYADRAYYVHRFATIALQKYIGKSIETEAKSSFFAPFGMSNKPRLTRRQIALLQNDIDKACKGLESLGIRLEVSPELSSASGVDIIAGPYLIPSGLPPNFVFTVQELTVEEETFPVEDHCDLDEPAQRACLRCGEAIDASSIHLKTMRAHCGK